MNKMDIRHFFNKPTRKSVEVSNFDTSNIYYTAVDTDIAIEAVNSSVPGTCSTSTATVSAETPAHLDASTTSGRKPQGRNSPYFLFSLSTKLEILIVPSHPFTTTSSHGLSTPFHWIQFFVFAVATFLQILHDAQMNCLQKWELEIGKSCRKS